MRWSQNQTYHFVKQYMRHENLWNSKHEHYKVSNIRMKSYKEIISQFRNVTGIDMNVAELKVKIKNLRTTYMQEVAKIKLRSGLDRTYRSNLRWFPVWHKRFFNANRGAVYEFTYEDQQDPIDDPSETQVAQTENTSHSSHINCFMDDEDYNVTYPAEPTVDLFNQFKIRKRKLKHLHSFNTELSDKRFSCNISSSECRKEDEFDIYGKYIAAQLRDMNLHKALRIQLEIQSILHVARTNLMEKES